MYQPDYPTLTPVPSPEFIQNSIERESIRRIFWLIHVMDIMRSVYFKQPTSNLGEQGMRLRLPADETSFELGVHSTLPGEFRTQACKPCAGVILIRLVIYFILILFAFTNETCSKYNYVVNRIPLPASSQNPVFVRIWTPHPRHHNTCKIGAGCGTAGW